jgi:hypothetical protein
LVEEDPTILVSTISTLRFDIPLTQNHSDQSHDVYIWNMLDITSACIVPSLPAYYPVFNAAYRAVFDISNSIREASNNFSLISRSNRRRSQASRHDTTTSMHLDEVQGSYVMSDDKSTNSAPVQDDPERPPDVPKGYVRKAPQIRQRERAEGEGGTQYTTDPPQEDNV